MTYLDIIEIFNIMDKKVLSAKLITYGNRNFDF